jgi:O-antigen/teichoic acid export membrane protein
MTTEPTSAATSATTDAVPGPDVISAPRFDHGLGRLFRNTFALAIGRNANALGRLVVASLIVRGLGAESFGVYSVIVALLAIADWLLDFGTTDVFVRETVKDEKRYAALRRALVAIKLVQVPLAMGMMTALLFALSYSEEIVIGGLVAAISIGFFAGVAVYRAIFKTTLTMEREMLAEFVSVLALIGLVVAAARLELGTMGLMVALCLSRGVFLVGCVAFASNERSLSFRGAKPSEVAWLARSSWLIGVIGLLIVVNNSIEILLLSKLSSLADAAYFSAAQKLTWPIFMVLGALGVSAYPVLAAQFPRSRAQFHGSCQRVFDVTILAGGLAISGVYAGAEFLTSLLGADMLQATPALRVLVIMCVAKSVAAVIGPALYIAGAQRHALFYFSIALALKAAVIGAAAAAYGFLGTAIATLVVEAFVITPITLWYVWRFTGFRPKLGIVAATAAIAAVSIAVAELLLPAHAFPRAILAGLVYCALLVATRRADLRRLEEFLRNKRGRAA